MSKKPILLAASDIHLEHHSYAAHPMMYGDSYHAVHQLAHLCRLHHVDLVLAGDVFERAYPDALTVSTVLHILDGVFHGPQDDTIRYCFFVQGQHDFATPPWLSLANDAVHIGCRLKDGLQVPGTAAKMAGLDYHHPSKLKQAIREMPTGCDILVFHQSWSEMVGNFPADGSLVEDVLSVHPNTKLIISGDVHISRQMTIKHPKGECLFLSPGPTSLQSLSETETKYAYLVYDDFTLKQIPLKTRPFMKSIIYDERDFDNAIRDLDRYIAVPSPDLPVYLQKPIWAVEHDEMPGIKSRLEEAAKGKAFLLTKEYRRVVEEDGDDSPVSPNISTSLAALLEEADVPDEIRVLGRDLLGCEDTASVQRVLTDHINTMTKRGLDETHTTRHAQLVPPQE